MPIAPELVRQLVSYDERSGKLYWKKRKDNLFDEGFRTAEHNCKIWNAKNAGKQAFCTLSDEGYYTGEIFRRHYKAHRVAWAIAHGVWPEQIDHINGIRSDNRLSNLREVGHSGNARNQGLHITNRSGAHGVTWRKRGQCWYARIRVDGKDRFLGQFKHVDEAIRVRKAAERRFGYHSNHGARRARGLECELASSQIQQSRVTGQQ